MIQRIICVLCALAITLVSVLPAHAEPVINEVIQAEVTGQAPPAPVVAAHSVYLPLIGKPQCYRLTSLAADGESELCAALAPYVGTQGPSSFIATVDGEHGSLFDTDMPQVAVRIPLTGTHIGPQSRPGGSRIVSSSVVRLSAVSYMTNTVEAAAVNDAPFAGRIAWTIMNALQDKSSATPTLFPVAITTLHYSHPRPGALLTTLFERCGAHLNAGQLALPGYPYDLIVDDDMTRGGSVWLAMRYPSCPEISGFPYIKLFDFWRSLKVFPQYQGIEAEAAALVGPSTYHVTNLQMKMPDGQVLLIGATIVVVAIGAVVIIAIFPEVGVGWWLLSGAAALQVEGALQQQEEVRRW